MEHLETQLAASDVVLSEEVLERIDEIVPPGTTINPADSSFNNPALEPAARRRWVGASSARGRPQRTEPSGTYSAKWIMAWLRATPNG